MTVRAVKIQITTLLKLQAVYAVSGSLFNAVSLWHVMNGAFPLTPTPPIAGLAVMALFVSCLIPGYLGRYGAIPAPNNRMRRPR